MCVFHITRNVTNAILDFSFFYHLSDCQLTSLGEQSAAHHDVSHWETEEQVGLSCASAGIC